MDRRPRLTTPTGKIHRNFKISKHADNLLRTGKKRTGKTQTALFEHCVETVLGIKGEVIHLSSKAMKLVFNRANREGRSPMAVLEDCVISALEK